MSNRENHPINGLMDVTLQKIHEMADGNSVMGSPITAQDGTIILPVSKVSYGFATGGSDVGAKAQRDMFGGGSGAGVSVVPVAFLVIPPNGEVRLLQVNAKPGAADCAVEMLPGIFNKITDIFAEKKAKKSQTAEDKT